MILSSRKKNFHLNYIMSYMGTEYKSIFTNYLLCKAIDES